MKTASLIRIGVIALTLPVLLLSGCGQKQDTSSRPPVAITTEAPSTTAAAETEIDQANAALSSANDSLSQADTAANTDEGDATK